MQNFTNFPQTYTPYKHTGQGVPSPDTSPSALWH